MEWININKELPDTIREVIGLNIHSGQVYTCRLWEIGKNYFIKTYKSDEGDYDAIVDITHWTELILPTN